MGSTACGPRRSYRGTGAGDRKIDDPVLRQEIAKVLAMSKAAESTARRARTAQEQGRPRGPEGSLGKLASSIIARAAARVHTSLPRPDALLTGDDSPMSGLLAEILMSVPARSMPAGRTRSSATSSANACSRCRASGPATRTSRSTMFREIP